MRLSGIFAFLAFNPFSLAFFAFSQNFCAFFGHKRALYCILWDYTIITQLFQYVKTVFKNFQKIFSQTFQLRLFCRFSLFLQVLFSLFFAKMTKFKQLEPRRAPFSRCARGASSRSSRGGSFFLGDEKREKRIFSSPSVKGGLKNFPLTPL